MIGPDEDALPLLAEYGLRARDRGFFSSARSGRERHRRSLDSNARKYDCTSTNTFSTLPKHLYFAMSTDFPVPETRVLAIASHVGFRLSRPHRGDPADSREGGLWVSYQLR